ncbi:Squamous cell carcinoma antigen recognized by T-cells 3 [Glycine soja]
MCSEDCSVSWSETAYSAQEARSKHPSTVRMEQNLMLAAEAEREKSKAMSDSDERMKETLALTAEAERDRDNSMSDFDDSDSEDEAQQNLQLESLQTELVTNPSNYDAHLQYITLLRRMGDVDKLSRAREAMSELFPLSPAIWRQWIKDELSLNTATRPEAFSRILKLYERGVFDYLSVSLWCDYINFVQEFDPMVRQCSPTGISKARDLFESALTAAGLHVAEGSKIWEAYRKYEQAILLTFDDIDAQAKEKQVQSIRSLFHRQLSVPLAGMSSTITAYKTWEVEQGSLQDVESIDLVDIYPHVAASYQKALDMYNARFHLEEQILSPNVSDSERLQHYMNYLKFEQSSGTPARIQVLYERAITDFPITPDLWLDYTCNLDNTLKVGNIVNNVYSRATKNCPWVGELWVRCMLSLERGHASEKDLSEIFEKSLQCTFSTLDEYLDLFLTRVDGLRRRMASSNEEDLEYKIIRETFQRASDYLSPYLKNTEGLLHLHAYWARLETKLGKDITAARGVWENCLKICGSMLESWTGYIAMEVELGHINEARSLYKRCYSKRFSGTGSEDICQSWLRFEREFGKLEDFDHALHKDVKEIGVCLSKLEHKRLHDLVFVKYNQQLKQRYNARDEIDPISLNDIDVCNEWLVGEMDQDDDNDAGNDLVFEDDDALNWATVYQASGVGECRMYTRRKKQKTSVAAAQTSKKQAMVVGSSSRKQKAVQENDEENIDVESEEIMVNFEASDGGEGDAPLPYDNNEDDYVTPRLEELKLFRIQQESKTAEESEKNPKRNAREKRKLGSDITEEQYPTKRFRDVGNPKKAPEENKYQLQNTSQVTKVEGANWKNTKIDDNPSEQQFNHEKNRAYSDQCTVFISNLHPTANYEHIRNFFGDDGGIVAIRILHDKFTGKSRGLAYVDFLDEEHLAAAIAKNRQKLIGKKLSIARSDPKRGGKESSNPKTWTEHARATNHSSQKGFVSKETDDTHKGDVKDAKFSSRKPGNDNIQLKGKNTFAVPRNVKPLGFTANKLKAEEGDEKPKSNEEFRKMFIR